MARLTGLMPSPVRFDELLGDPALRLWYFSMTAPGMPPQYPTFGAIPVSVWKEWEYLQSVLAG